MGEVVLLSGAGIRIDRKGLPPLYPVQNVDLSVRAGDRTALVGESGCGKSLTARLLTGLLPRNAVLDRGSATLLGEFDLADEFPDEVRGSRVAMIFQDPVSVLDPMAGIGVQIGRALAAAGVARAERRGVAVDLLGSLHIPAPEEVARKYPHQLSGGMCQRVAIAMALAPNPDLLIADEPTTSLDVTTEIQVLDLLEEYLDGSGASLILISHDLNVVKRLAGSVTVMYAGQSVEYGPISDILNDPAHPYSRDLVRSSVLNRGKRAYSIAGTLPSIEEVSPTCPYQARCGEARSACSDTVLGQAPSAGGFVRCLFPLKTVRGDSEGEPV
ncbi:MAG: ABC transporter ATP-binding protein [bacterium]|nr:ABC transporter ATP-binding protein [bacterium]